MKRVGLFLFTVIAAAGCGTATGRVVILKNDRGQIATCERVIYSVWANDLEYSVEKCIKQYEALGYKVVPEPK
jgi:hypothetical protein